MDIKEIQAWRTIVAILQETGYDKLYDEEVHIVAECLCRCKQQCKKQKEAIDRIKAYVNPLRMKQKYEKQVDNWNKLKDYIVKEYYMYLPLEANTKSITILIDKMHELEGSDSNGNN